MAMVRMEFKSSIKCTFVYVKCYLNRKRGWISLNPLKCPGITLSLPFNPPKEISSPVLSGAIDKTEKLLSKTALLDPKDAGAALIL